MNFKWLLFLVCLVNSLSLQSQDFSYSLSDDSTVNYYASLKKVYEAVRIKIKPKIDGNLDDACWQNEGNWEGGFIQQQPQQAKAPSQQTVIKILYDDTYLYIGFVCHDNEPHKIRKVLGRRDENNGDMAAVAIDSYYDRQTAFEFNVTAAGQKVDLMHLGEYGWDYNWDAVWDGKASVGDSAWYAEMRIPFSQLRYSNKEEHIWGIHIWRWIDRLKEEDHWKLIPVDAPAMVYIFGELRGINNIPNKRNFELLPYAKTKFLPASEKMGQKAFSSGVGLDGKIGVTTNFTLDYTINPDFGQVEADPSELNLTSYELFYDEKRPFFLEGNSILDYETSGDLLFYSRRIGAAPVYYPATGENETLAMPGQTSILNALKLTGKNHSGFSLGIINSMTAPEHAVITLNNKERTEAVEPFTNYFIGRIKQDFNKGKTVLGGMVTSTLRKINDDHLEYLPQKSLVGGIDFQHNWLNRKYFINGKSFISKVSGSQEAIVSLQLDSRHLYQREDAEHLEFDPSLTAMQGWGGEVRGGKRSGKFRLTGSIDWRSPGVELNDAGYLWQADYINQGINLLYWINKPQGFLNSYYIDLQQKHKRSFGGEKLGDELSAHVRLQLKNLWKLDIVGGREIYKVDTRQLRGGPSLRIDGNNSARIFVQTNSSKNLFMGGGPQVTWNDDNVSQIKQFSFYVQWLLGTRFSLISNTSVSFQTDNNQYVMQKIIDDKRKYVVGTIDRKTLSTILRAELFVTPELSFQYYGNPYASVGQYQGFRQVSNSKSTDINQRFSPLFINAASGEKLLVDEKNFLIRDLKANNPDFNFQEFRSTFVARWEYKTGSTMYFVWTNNRSRYESLYIPSLIESLKGINNVKSDNAFMLKVSFWFSL